MNDSLWYMIVLMGNYGKLKTKDICALLEYILVLVNSYLLIEIWTFTMMVIGYWCNWWLGANGMLQSSLQCRWFSDLIEENRVRNRKHSISKEQQEQEKNGALWQTIGMNDLLLACLT